MKIVEIKLTLLRDIRMGAGSGVWRLRCGGEEEVRDRTDSEPAPEPETAAQPVTGLAPVEAGG